MGRRRFRAQNQFGTFFGVSLPRDGLLEDGAVLLLDSDRAVIVDAEENPELSLRATTIAGGIQPGWHAGHLHWKVRMVDESVAVMLEGPTDEYLDRIRPLLASGAIVVEDEPN